MGFLNFFWLLVYERLVAKLYYCKKVFNATQETFSKFFDRNKFWKQNRLNWMIHRIVYYKNYKWMNFKGIFFWSAVVLPVMSYKITNF
jgi:hypothetical protein